jgi:alkanesulfonate monooxygenase SsuD/methylene tetrahydromethanopterin reductase-like flavin-dependent oxidoreductase (luciferase family)
LWSPEERAAVNQMFHYSFIGSKETIAGELSSFVEGTGVSELMIATHIYDEKAKMRSLELTSSLFKTHSSAEQRV